MDKKKAFGKHYRIGSISLNENHKIIIDNIKQQIKIQLDREGQNLPHYFDQSLGGMRRILNPHSNDLLQKRCVLCRPRE